MDPVWLIRNMVTSWRRHASLVNYFKDLMWIYGPKLGLAGRELDLAFHYPAPVGGIRVRARVNRGADAFIYGEVFDHEYYRLPLAAVPKTILDLGANIGLTAIYFGRQFPHAAIACVEPFPANARLLNQNLQLNNVAAEVFPAAIDTEDGQVRMTIDANDYGHHVVRPDTVGNAWLDVPAISVSSIMKKLGWDRIDLMKVDIEGHEKVLFLRNCDWLEKVDALCIEWHDEREESRRQLTAIAERFGFNPPELLPGVWFMTRR